jgi:hypothetical protein
MWSTGKLVLALPITLLTEQERMNEVVPFVVGTNYQQGDDRIPWSYDRLF